VISSTETETTTPSAETTTNSTAVVVEGAAVVVEGTTAVPTGTTVVVSGSTSFDYLKKASEPTIKGSIVAIFISFILSVYALNVS
jgi:4-hydroxy-L-threonine phosphate dehydrogenase PdxA